MTIKTNHKNTVYVGDIHGKFGELGFEIYNRFKLEDTLIICLGDIGMGFESDGYYNPVFSKLQKKLEKLNSTLVFFRGNHDDPGWFQGTSAWSRIEFADDYSIIEQNGIKSLIVGGGLSVDRSYRKQHTNNGQGIYWPNESIILPDATREWLKEQKDISIMLTHMAPKCAWPHTKIGIQGWLREDPNLIVEDEIQRGFLTEIKDILNANGNKITNWFYGHYHEDHLDIIDNIKYRCVEMNKVYEERE